MARQLPYPMVLSIDWDFFLWRACEAVDPTTTLFPGTDKENTSKGNGIMLFDWGHSENWKSPLQDLFWTTRWGSFRRVGLDPYVTPGFRFDKGCVDPFQFIEDVKARLDIPDGITLTASESHAAALYVISGVVDAMKHVAKKLDGYLPKKRAKVDVIHFDAHHDLGYPNSDVKEEFSDGCFNCASWLWHGLRLGEVNKVYLVYPDWRGLEEWEASKSQPHLKRFAGRIIPTTYSQWLKSGRRGPVAAMTVARSGSWCPPWFDGEFDRFVKAFPHNEFACLDCDDPAEERKNSPHACTPREWDDEEADAFADGTNSLLEEAAKRSGMTTQEIEERVRAELEEAVDE